MKNKPCKYCGSIFHFPFQCYQNPKRKNSINSQNSQTIRTKRTKIKPINKVSTKQSEYLKWREKVVRPFLIDRDGNICQCCKRPAYDNEKLDIDEIKGRGSHPELKRDLNNMQLLCRFPCHRLKTDNKKCNHFQL